jgi:cytochrome c oxidase assembly factor CtaG
MAAMGVLGAVLAAAPAPLYRAYPDLAAQAEAGGVMWIGGMAVVLPLLLLAAWRALAAEERRQRARERHG